VARVFIAPAQTDRLRASRAGHQCPLAILADVHQSLLRPLVFFVGRKVYLVDEFRYEHIWARHCRDRGSVVVDCVCEGEFVRVCGRIVRRSCEIRLRYDNERYGMCTL